MLLAVSSKSYKAFKVQTLPNVQVHQTAEHHPPLKMMISNLRQGAAQIRLFLRPKNICFFGNCMTFTAFGLLLKGCPLSGKLCIVDSQS